MLGPSHKYDCSHIPNAEMAHIPRKAPTSFEIIQVQLILLFPSATPSLVPWKKRDQSVVQHLDAGFATSAAKAVKALDQHHNPAAVHTTLACAAVPSPASQIRRFLRLCCLPYHTYWLFSGVCYCVGIDDLVL